MLTVRRKTSLGVLAALLGALIGCGDRVDKDVAAMNASNIQRVVNMYAAFQNYKNGRGPKDDAEFKAFIKDFDKEKLGMMKIDPTNVDAIFMSERDGRPFKMRYGVGGGRGSSDPVAFEEEGKDGKKQVGFTGGKVEDADDATYAQLMAGNKGSDGRSPGGNPSAGNRTSGTGAPEGAPTGPPR